MIRCGGMWALVVFVSASGIFEAKGQESPTAPPGRPWDVKGSLDGEFRDRVKAAGKDVTKLKELATWCLEQGAPHLVSKTFESTQLTPEIAPLLGYQPDSNPPALADVARFSATPRVLPALLPLVAKRKKDLLAAKDRSLKLANQSTYFDLTSDLDSSILDQHSKMLNDYYRSMKSRFRVYPETNVDVVIFASRSDYLRDYAMAEGKSGENILGYFLPGIRALFFYDDPYDRDEISLVARHECTHLLFDVAYKSSRIPDWLNEGMACYLAGDGEHARGGYTMRLVAELAAQSSSKGFDLMPLFTVKHDDLKYEHYAQSWVMVLYLQSSGRNEKFQKFLVALRDKLTPEAKEADGIRIVREELEAAFTESSASLAEGCATFVKERMNFQRPDQLLELGLAFGQRARYEKPGLPVDQLTEASALALKEAIPNLKGDELARAKLGEAWLLLHRASASKADSRGWRITLLSLVERLKSMPTLVDESQVAILIRDAVEWAALAAGTQPPKNKPRDLVAELRNLAAKKKGAEAEELMVLTVIVEDLLEIAYGRLSKALEIDPLHRRAGRQWVMLSMKAAPHKLKEVYPLLKLLVERDASDEALATLGVAYIGLGNAQFGKSLLKRASEFTAQPASIAELLAWQQ